MLVMTKAPIIEEVSSANGKKGKRAKSGKVADSFRRGYSRLKDAGGIATIENLLGVGTLDPNLATQTPVGGGGSQNMDTPPPPPPPPIDEKKPLTKTTKLVLWSVGILAVAGISYYLYTRSKGGKVSSAKIKA
jgi:hypothetical protein